MGYRKLFSSFSCIFLFVLTGTNSTAQVYTNKVVGKKNQALADSLKTAEYPYVLPIWGQKATSKGFNLPYSAGFSVQYFWQESDLIIDNLEVGFNHGTMHNLDQIVRFDKAKATANATTFRPDIWLFPFLNIYGIFGIANASTDIGYSVWIPDTSGTEKQIFSSGTKIEFSTHTYGFGITPTIGVGGGFLALDMNFAWTDVPQLDKPAQTFVFGPRLGKSFKFKKPQRNIAFWVGGFRVHLNSSTSGSIALSDALPVDELQGKIDNGNIKVDQAQQQVDAWWTGLTPAEQRNPVNKAKYETSNALLDRTGNLFYNAQTALNNAEQSTVEYKMEKRPADMWNFIVGSQFQYNKHFMLRAEYGFLTSRTQFLIGLQYRFGL